MVVNSLSVVRQLARARTLLMQTEMLTPAQLRAARALLDWSRKDLAKKSGTAAETVQGFESRGSDPKLSTLNAWRRALEVAGVVFIDPNPMGGDDMGPGVRLRSAKAKR
jgi:transcriptional regulator with XRE-family HTH domain